MSGLLFMTIIVSMGLVKNYFNTVQFAFQTGLGLRPHSQSVINGENSRFKLKLVFLYIFLRFTILLFYSWVVDFK